MIPSKNSSCEKNNLLFLHSRLDKPLKTRTSKPGSNQDENVFNLAKKLTSDKQA
ncbi:hypothetical protein CANFE03_01480 [Ligilactobacillus animalis]